SLSGSHLAGASFAGVLSDGSSLPMRIDSVSQGSGSNLDVWFYNVSYRSDGSWEPLCGDDANGNPIAAVALAGPWDYSENTPTGGSWTASSARFTFGCLRTVFGVVDQCILSKVLNLGCGAKSHFSSGTLLMNEYRDLNLLGLVNL